MPPPSRLDAEIYPPCISTNCLAMVKPRPKPRLQKPKSPEEWRLGSSSREKRLKQVIECLRLQSDAAIFDADLACVRAASERRDFDQTAVRRELDRVGEQVDEDRADLVGVDLERAEIVGHIGREPEIARHGERPDLVEDSVDQLAKIHRPWA